MKLDPRTEKNLATLTPPTQAKAREFMELAIPAMRRSGFIIRIISGNRTYEEQDALYNQRTKNGGRVTKARGGYSNHNFGIAFDVGLFDSYGYLEESKQYDVCGKLGESIGLIWGGHWPSFVDKPHFQLNTGKTLAQLRAEHQNHK